jgi:RNA recognition motif-containing protein
MEPTGKKRRRYAEDGSFVAVVKKKKKKRRKERKVEVVEPIAAGNTPVDLFIGNLPREATESDIHEFIKTRITSLLDFSVRLATKKNGTSKCMAFVTLPNSDVAASVRKLHGLVFPTESDAKPRRVRIQATSSAAPKAPRVLTVKEKAAEAASEAEKKKRSREDWTVVVGNLPYQAEKKEVHAFFEEALGIAPTLTKLLKRRGQSRGVAMVSFDSVETLRRAILLNQADFSCAGVQSARAINVEVANKTNL